MEVYKKALTKSPTYKAEIQKYGTGSDFLRAAQAMSLSIWQIRKQILAIYKNNFMTGL
ncbi:hypothetical protein [Pectobacterium versatile]|uniref:hypothetical protein n=1 Tax=Pectobacterium versatile TaxID=2488639 RepID=UPI0020C182D8|nr:hypothetical protein [Pectobacterium versatile]